ncbi:hypothetical protein [Pseudolysinimonas sp.]
MAWSQAFDLTFHGWPGYFEHTFRTAEITVDETAAGEVFTDRVECRTLAADVQLFRFRKPVPGMLVHVDAVVDFGSGVALAVHQSVPLIGSSGPRISVERATVGRQLGVDSLVAFATWEEGSGRVQLEGEDEVHELVVLPRGRLAPPHRGRVLGVSKGVVAALVESRSRTAVAFVSLADGFHSTTLLASGAGGPPSRLTNEGRATFSWGD